MKISNVLQMQQSLSVLANTKLSAKVSYRVARALAKFASVLTTTQAAQMELYKKYGVLNEDGSQYVVADENKPALQADLAVLFDQDAGIEIATISVADLGDVAIEPAHLLALDGFLLTDVAVPPMETTGTIPPELTVVSNEAA